MIPYRAREVPDISRIYFPVVSVLIGDVPENLKVAEAPEVVVRCVAFPKGIPIIG